MAFQEKILGQSRPANSTAATIYTVPASTTAIVTTIHICNTSGNDVTFRIFIDNDGSTYDETTALYWDTSIRSDETVQLQTHVGMDNATGTVGVRTSAGNALTFTVNGVEIT